MAAVREIPGMYYDEDLGKYFKIQPHHVAPKGAKYTKEAISNQIKAKARKDQQERHSRYMAVFNPIRRERTLRSTTATGYMLHRSLYPGLQLPKPHLWSAGIRFKHCTQVWTPNEPSRSRVVQQLAPLCPDSYVIVASDEVSATITIHRYGESEIAAASGEQFPNVTASVIRPDYFVVASDEVVTVGLPVIRDDGGLSYLDHVEIKWEFDRIRPVRIALAHPSDPRYVLLGSENGLTMLDVELDHEPWNREVKWFRTPASQKKYFPSNDLLSAAWLRDSVIASGYRDGRIILTDTRSQGTSEGSSVLRALAPTTVHALQNVNAHQIIAAGPKNNLHMYDLRNIRGSPLSRNDVSRPFISYSEYVNAADVDLPIALSRQFNVLAAGSANGAIQVFDVWSGREIRSKLESPQKEWSRRSPARSLLFNDQTRGTRGHPRLLVGKRDAVEEWHYEPPGQTEDEA